MTEAAAPPRAAIGRLTAFDAALAAIARIAVPTPLDNRPLVAALGLVAAAPAVAEGPAPPTPRAARDGWAVRASDIAGASPSSPLPLAPPPFVALGDPLPPDADAVLAPADLVALGPIAEALAEIAPGEGVAAAGSDAAAGARLVEAGDIVSALHLPVLRAAGIGRVAVRAPRIAIVPAAAGPADDAAGPLVARVAAAGGGRPDIRFPPQGESLADFLPTLDHDAIIVVGGTGDGGNDATLRALAACGEVLLHGIGCWPAASSGLAVIAGRPALALPGRPDAAFAGALLLAGPLLRGLAGGRPAVPRPLPLGRKIVSRPGLVELRFVALDEAGAHPLPASPVPLGALAAAAGYVVVPAGGEGFAAGALAPVYALP